MNRNFISATLIAFCAATPVMSFAQTSTPVTHESRINELAQLEMAGYNPAFRDLSYPAGLQAAEARIGNLHAESAAAVGSVSIGLSGNDVSR